MAEQRALPLYLRLYSVTVLATDQESGATGFCVTDRLLKDSVPTAP